MYIYNNIYMYIYIYNNISELVLELERLTQKLWENLNTHFVLSNFSRTSRGLWDNVEKYGRVGQAIDDNEAVM
jgi:hypothetical protein